MRQPGNRFVSCVRCEAVCTRETMLFLSLGLATVNSAPALGLGLGRALGRGRAFPWRFLGFVRYFHYFCLILLILVNLVW